MRIEELGLDIYGVVHTGQDRKGELCTDPFQFTTRIIDRISQKSKTIQLVYSSDPDLKFEAIRDDLRIHLPQGFGLFQVVSPITRDDLTFDFNLPSSKELLLEMENQANNKSNISFYIDRVPFTGIIRSLDPKSHRISREYYFSLSPNGDLDHQVNLVVSEETQEFLNSIVWPSARGKKGTFSQMGGLR